MKERRPPSSVTTIPEAMCLVQMTMIVEFDLIPEVRPRVGETQSGQDVAWQASVIRGQVHSSLTVRGSLKAMEIIGDALSQDTFFGTDGLPGARSKVPGGGVNGPGQVRIDGVPGIMLQVVGLASGIVVDLRFPPLFAHIGVDRLFSLYFHHGMN